MWLGPCKEPWRIWTLSAMRPAIWLMLERVLRDWSCGAIRLISRKSCSIRVFKSVMILGVTSRT